MPFASGPQMRFLAAAQRTPHTRSMKPSVLWGAKNGDLLLIIQQTGFHLCIVKIINPAPARCCCPASTSLSAQVEA